MQYFYINEKLTNDSKIKVLFPFEFYSSNEQRAYTVSFPSPNTRNPLDSGDMGMYIVSIGIFRMIGGQMQN